MDPDVTWKNIFNSEHSWWGWIGKCRDMARLCGYPYFAWNGYVYSVKDDARICLVSQVDTY